jgi:hypothetical protein
MQISLDQGYAVDGNYELRLLIQLKVVWSFIIALILTIIVNSIVLLIQAIEVCSGLDILRSKKE